MTADYASAATDPNGAVRFVPRPGPAAQARRGTVGGIRANPGLRTASRYQRIEQVLDARAVFPLFQPLVRSDDRAVVGYEALIRGPVGTPWESPLGLFSAAAEVGRQAELDWACRARIGRAAITAGLDSTTALFVNADARAVATPCPEDLRPAIVEATRLLHIIIELPERAVATNPATLLAAAAAYREAGCGIALDDVGTNPASLALLPLLDPDVIKFDQGVVRQPESAATARTVNGVLAHAEQSRAVVAAEGVETAEHLATARSLGASVVQGRLTGRPGPLPDRGSRSLPPDGLRRPIKPLPVGTPYELLSVRQPIRAAGLETLLALSHQLEEAALAAAEPPVVLGSFPPARCQAEDIRTRLARLASSAALVLAVGDGVNGIASVGVHGGSLGSWDPLRTEWNVIVLGPHFAGALVARDLGDSPGRGGESRFGYVLTYQRSLVLHAARAMLRCLTP